MIYSSITLSSVFFSCVRRKSLAGVSFPKSETTTHEHWTTFLALPSLSILHRPAISPRAFLSSTLTSGHSCSLHRASTSLVYVASSQSFANIHIFAFFLSRARADSSMPLARPSTNRLSLRTCLSADGTSIPLEAISATLYW